MKLFAATSIGLILAMAAGAACAQGFGSKTTGGFGSSGGTFGSVPRTKPGQASPNPWAPSPAAPARPRAATPNAGPDTFEPFKPYKGKSIYSDRGGLDSYPQPPRIRRSSGF